MWTKSLLFIIAFAVVAFSKPDNPAILKGQLKRIDYYLSNTHDDFIYDTQGNLKSILEPYGRRVNFTYNANYIFRETIDPRGYTFYDTAVIKAACMRDSILTGDGFWLTEYGLKGEEKSETFIPVKGKKRKAGKNEYTHSYSYFCYEEALGDTTISMQSNLCDRYFRKSYVCVNAGGDTTLNFHYKYLFNNDGTVKTEMEYYPSGQLYDSVGYVYY